MNRNDFLKQTALGAGALLLGTAARAREGVVSPRDMNILLLTSEDTPREGVGRYGNPVVKTPHLDAFAKTGVQFDRAFCQAPVCNPSRTSFATGLYPDKTNVWGNTDRLDKRMPARYITLPEYLREQGFFTCAVGKFFHHNYHANKQARAWDQLERSLEPANYEGLTLGSKLYAPGNDVPPNPTYPYRWDENPEVEKKIQEAYEDFLTVKDKYPPSSKEYRAKWKPFQIAQASRVGDSMDVAERNPDGIKARTAAEQLRRFAKSKQRFFMSVQCQKPHTPFLCPRKYLDMYPLDSIETTKEGKDKDVGVPKIARRNDQERFGPNQFYGTERQALQAFYACCSFMDEQFGLVLDALKETGLDENTIVIYFGDHGFQIGQHGLWCKNTLFQQSIAVPLIIRVPGASENGTRCGAPVELADLFPTLINGLGLPDLPYGIDGESLESLIDKSGKVFPNARKRTKQYAYCVNNLGKNFGYTVVGRQYRYTEHRRDGELVSSELYDLEKDPYEHVNLASRSEHREAVQQMASALEKGFPNKDRKVAS